MPVGSPRREPTGIVGVIEKVGPPKDTFVMRFDDGGRIDAVGFLTREENHQVLREHAPVGGWPDNWYE